MNRCKTCRWWDRQQPLEVKYKWCLHEQIVGREEFKGDGGVLTAFSGMATGPDFGCVHHEVTAAKG